MTLSVNIGLGLTGMFSTLITWYVHNFCFVFLHINFNKNIFPRFNFKAFKNIYNFSEGVGFKEFQEYFMLMLITYNFLHI